MDTRSQQEKDRDALVAQAGVFAHDKDDAGYWGGVSPAARDAFELTPHQEHVIRELAPGVVEDSRLPGDTVLYGSPEQNLAALDESAIEVKYTPNRAQRRAAQQAARRSVRRGQRAADRQVKELEDGMTPEEIERARRLAAKVLRDRRG